MIGPFLLFIGVFLLFVSSQGKSEKFLNALGFEQKIKEEQTNIAKGLTTWAQNNIWTPLGNQLKQVPFIRIGS